MEDNYADYDSAVKDDAETAVENLLRGLAAELKDIPDCEAKNSAIKHLAELSALLV